MGSPSFVWITLNAVTYTDAYHLPTIQEILDSLAGSVVFSTIDLNSGYWQCLIDEQQGKNSFQWGRKKGSVLPGWLDMEQDNQDCQHFISRRSHLNRLHKVHHFGCSINVYWCYNCLVKPSIKSSYLRISNHNCWSPWQVQNLQEIASSGILTSNEP